MTKTDVYKIQRYIRDVFARSKHYKKKKESCLSESVGPRKGVRYDCEVCGKPFSVKDMELHHEPPILEGDIAYDEIGWNEFIRRVWADEEYTFYLCKSCHKEHHKWRKKQ